MEDLCCYRESQPESLAGIAHTLGARRDHLLYRAFCIATRSARTLNFESFEKKLTGAVEVIFVFTGQGAQWAGMGRDLIQGSSSFCADIRRMDKVLQDLPEPPHWTIEGSYFMLPYNTRLSRARIRMLIIYTSRSQL